MTTLAVDKPRATAPGGTAINDIPVIASDIIYEGAAVGIVAGTGHCRPLVAGDAFGGFCVAQADNSLGSAAAINARVLAAGRIQLPVTGAVITDMHQAVYASDDDTFSFSPVGGTFVGRVSRFISAGVVMVEFNAYEMRDPWNRYSVREALSATKTFDAEDCGKLFCVDSGADDAVLTLPAIAAGLSGLAIMAVSAFGTTKVKLDPNASDMILGPDITGADNKDLILTKATQRRGDYAVLIAGDTDGYMVTELVGTWAREP